MRRLIPLLGLLVLTGCATDLKAKVIGVFGEPILGFAVEDAKTTLAMIAQHGYPDVAKECPQAVLDLAAYRDKLAAESGPTGTKGLIYLGVEKKYGGTTSEMEARAALRKLAACLDLVPIDKVLMGGGLFLP